MSKEAAAEKDKDVYEYIPPIKAVTPQPVGVGNSGSTHDNIELTSINLERAYETFMGKTFPSGGGIDNEKGFPIGTKLRYLNNRETYQCIASSDVVPNNNNNVFNYMGNFETPIQRLTRLQNEVDEFLLLLSTKQSLNIDISQDTDTDPLVVHQELNTLREQINILLTDKRLDSEIPQIYPTSGQRTVSSTLLKKLEKSMDMIRSGGCDNKHNTTTATTTDNNKDTKGKDDGSVVYELYYTPSAQNSLDMSRLVGLESRLAHLEEQVGTGAASRLPFPDVVGGVSEISERLSLLDSNKLDAIGRRVQALLTEIDVLLQQKKALEESGMHLSASGLTGDEEQKICDMYELTHRWQGVSASLPAVVGRLKSLKALHQQSGLFANKINVLESQQDDLAKLLKTTADAVSGLSTGAAENVQKMKDTAVGIDKRIQALIAKK
eukprot:GHVR01133320.1.p1 GENE.GHVR01133320.1~~GHVR01133320.1.p1  ORF type:complete len:437 (-),score=135.39 GHVR01133320.1:357-1667(-)